MTFSQNIRDLVGNGSTESIDAILSIADPEELHSSQILSALKEAAGISELLSRDEFMNSSFDVLGSRGYDIVRLRADLQGAICGIA